MQDKKVPILGEQGNKADDELFRMILGATNANNEVPL